MKTYQRKCDENVTCEIKVRDEGRQSGYLFASIELKTINLKPKCKDL